VPRELLLRSTGEQPQQRPVDFAHGVIEAVSRDIASK
jgi:hypothetical protein